MDTMVNLNELAQQLHAAAVEKGFWDVEDAEIKHIAKMHSELSEAVQEDRCGRPMLYVDDIEVMDRITDPAMFGGRKPEGVAAELADFVMMALDFCAWIELDIDGIIAPKMGGYRAFAINDYKKASLCTLVLECHSALTKATLADDVMDIFAGMSIMIYGVEMWLEQRGYNLSEIIRLKMEYNRSRPKLHGRAY